MLNAEIAMAEALLEMGKWDYWINLSSTDYPLKSSELPTLGFAHKSRCEIAVLRMRACRISMQAHTHASFAVQAMQHE